jgi:hypothetical protein
MARVPTTKAALLASGAACIASVSSRPADPDEWDRTSAYTQLSLWWEEDEARPFIAVVEGLLGPAAAPHMVERFKAVTKGTLDAALNWFEPSNLRDELADAIPSYAEERFPDAMTIRAARAAEGRFYSGEPNMRDVVVWLYDDEDANTSSLANSLEQDFGVPMRTAFNALQGGNLSGWGKAFVAAMRFFDRKAFDRALREREADDDLE